MSNRTMNPETVAPPVGMYSHAVEIAGGGRVVYISGQVGIDPEGNVPDDFSAQAENAWNNLIKILTHNGMSMKDVVKIKHFLTRADDIGAYNEVRGKFLGAERPASTLLVVAALARPEFLIEVEMVAAASAA